VALSAALMTLSASITAELAFNTLTSRLAPI
jgi:hypothetical protein